MILNELDSQRFYKIWLSIIQYTNHKFNMVPNMNDLVHANQINPNAILPIKEKLWDNISILDEIYLTNPFDFSKADLDILKSWKNKIAGQFVILKHLKNYTIMISNDRVYGVTGIISPIEEMYPSFRLPIVVEAVLIPFEGKIIYDSIMIPYNVRFGSGSKKQFNDGYRDLKAKFGIVTSLERK